MNGARARGVFGVLAFAGLLLGVRGFTQAKAEHGASVPTVELWIAATPHVDFATSSELRFVRHGEDLEVEQRWATIHHAPNAPIRGDVLSDRKSVVIAFEPEGADPRDDFSTEVHRVDSQGSKRLAGGLYRATRPLVAKSGRVFVERGHVGREPTSAQAAAGQLRVDALSIDSIDPLTGALETVVQWSGYTMHLIGEWRDALVVYRVAPEGGDLALIRISDGSILRSIEIEPVARDFLLSDDRVAFSNHDAKVDDRWVLQALDLHSFALATLGEATGQSPIPFVTSNGTIGMRAEPRTRPSVKLEGAVPLLGHERPDLPLAMSADGMFTVVTTPGEYDQTEDVYALTKRRVRLTRGDERVEFIGYREGSKGVLR